MGPLFISSTNRQRKRGGRFFIQTAEGNSSSSSQPGDSNRRQGTVSIQMHPEETDDSLRGCGRRGEYGYEDHNSKRREQNILPFSGNPPHGHQEKYVTIIIVKKRRVTASTCIHYWLGNVTYRKGRLSCFLKAGKSYRY